MVFANPGFRIILLHPGVKIFKLGMLSSFSSLKYILGYILFEWGNQLNLAIHWLFTAKLARVPQHGVGW